MDICVYISEAVPFCIQSPDTVSPHPTLNAKRRQN
jgi:hypothetical protein